MCFPATIWPLVSVEFEQHPSPVRIAKEESRKKDKSTKKKKKQSTHSRFSAYPWHLTPEAYRKRRTETDQEVYLNEYYSNYYRTYYAQRALNETAHNSWQVPHWYGNHDPGYYSPPPRPLYWNGTRWVVESPLASGKPDDNKGSGNNDQTKDGDGLEYVGHYVAYGQTPTIAEGIGPDGKYHYNFFGRSKEQTAEDMNKHAQMSGANSPQEMEPKDAKSHSRFWVLHSSYANGRMLLPFATIRGFNGSWKTDPQHGNPYFVREEE